MKDFDIYPLGNPQPERIFFFLLSDLRSGKDVKKRVRIRSRKFSEEDSNLNKK